MKEFGGKKSEWRRWFPILSHKVGSCKGTDGTVLTKKGQL